MIIKITSNNLDSILEINPNYFNGTYLREMGSGVAFRQMLGEDALLGFVMDHHSGVNQISTFFDQPQTAYKLVSQMWKRSSTPKEDYNKIELPWLNTTMGELDQGPTRLEVELTVTNTWVNILDKYYDWVHWDGETFIMESQMSVFDTLNTFMFFMLLLEAKNQDYYVHYAQIDKALKSLDSIPYFVTYLTAHLLIRSPKEFEKHKAYLEEKCAEDVELVQGNTHDLRIKEITSRLSMDLPILDYGCGDDMRYARKLSRKFNSDYYAFDLLDYISWVPELQKRMELTYLNEEFHLSQPVQLIFSEVVEHMDQEALEAARNQFAQLKFSRILVTTPNVSFNKYYMLEGVRREDHVKEYTMDEFKETMAFLFPNYSFQFGGIGDTVNGEQPTLFAWNIQED